MKDLSNSKIWIGDNPELSEKVQKRLFELGYKWKDSKKNVINVDDGIYIRESDLILTVNKSAFDSKNYKEIFLSDLFEEEYKDFPIEGYCESLDTRLTTYLKSRPNNISEHKEITPSCIGTAWNSNSYWYIVSPSSKKEYKLKSLLKFTEEDLSKVPYTEWEVGDTIERIKENSFRNLKVGDRFEILKVFPLRLKGFNLEINFDNSSFKLVKRASNQSEDTFVLPEEWYVRVTEQNKEILSKWRGTSLTSGQITGMYILYGSKTPIREHNNTPSGNWKNEITFEQFEKYVLKTIHNNLTNNNLNKQENGSTIKQTNSSSEQGIKVFRSNINVSEGIGIRGSSIKSTRSKIYVGSNNSYN